MSELHSKFDALPYKKRFNLEVGDSAKVCAVFGKGGRVTGERFWVIITAVEPGTGRYQGVVDNHLVNSDSHGLCFRDLISFEPRHIYDAVLKSEAAEMNRKARAEMAAPEFKNVTLKATGENRPLASETGRTAPGGSTGTAGK